MRSRFIDYETSLEGELESGSPEPAAEPAAEPEPEWAPPGQEWYGQMDQFVQTAGPVLQQMGSYLQQQQEQPEYAQYAEPEYVEGETDPVQYVNDLVEARVNAVLGAYEPILGYVANREAENATREALSSIAKEIGEFDHDQAVFVSLRLQDQGVDPEQALRAAAQRQREFEEQLRNAAVEEYKASLGRSSEQVATQPGVTTGTATEIAETPTGPDKYTVMAERWVRDQL